MYPKLQMLYCKSLQAIRCALGEECPGDNINRGVGGRVHGYYTHQGFGKVERNPVMLHRAYSTYFSPQASPTTSKPTLQCPKCQCQLPSLAHSLWQCPEVASFWDSVHSYVNSTLRKNTLKNPLLNLFRITNKTNSQRDTEPTNTLSLKHICYLIAKRCLLKSWIYPYTPIMETFRSELDRLFRLE